MKGLGKRIARLESGTGDGMASLQLLTIHDLVVSDATAMHWPDDIVGVRCMDAGERLRHDGETGEAFRARLCREHGVRGPAGALPYAIVELLTA